jgi:hypothetical protein
LNAKPDGSGLSAPGGQVPSAAGSTPPPASGTNTTDPAAIASCIQKAGGDINKIKACAGQ